MKDIEKYWKEDVPIGVPGEACGMVRFSDNELFKSLPIEIKDEGGKRHFSTGAVRDSEDGKEDMCETISWLALREYARYMTEKKKTYGEGNWSKGIDPEAYIRSNLRHIRKFLCEWNYGICEEKTQHLCAILFNTLGLIHELELYKMGKGRFEISEHYKKLYLDDNSSKSET